MLGVDAGASGDGAFWTAFLCSLVESGLRRVRLVTSYAQGGLKAGCREGVARGKAGKGGRVHFMQKPAGAACPTAPAQSLRRIVRTVFVRPDLCQRLSTVADGRRGPTAAPSPRPRTLLTDAAEDLFGYKNLHHLIAHYRFCALRPVSPRRNALDIHAAITEAGDA